MPLTLQAKLLRVLEERSFHRVGGESPIPLKARIVCATSASLDGEVRRGAFREDLLYRINAVTVELPPLRERPEDISWLLSRYFSLFAEQAETELRGISSMAEGVALSHLWRGNVRELRNRVERAVNLANGPWIMPADIFPELAKCRARRRRSNAAPRSGARRGREEANRASSPAKRPATLGWRRSGWRFRERRCGKRCGAMGSSRIALSSDDIAPVVNEPECRDRWIFPSSFPNRFRYECSEFRTAPPSCEVLSI